MLVEVQALRTMILVHKKDHPEIFKPRNRIHKNRLKHIAVLEFTLDNKPLKTSFNVVQLSKRFLKYKANV